MGHGVCKRLRSSAKHMENSSNNSQISTIISDDLECVGMYTRRKERRYMDGNLNKSDMNSAIDLRKLCPDSQGKSLRKYERIQSGSMDIINMSSSKKQYQFVSSNRRFQMGGT